MKNIMLRIDDLSAKDFYSFSNDTKQQLSTEVSSMICKIAFDTRVKQLKKIVEQINADTTGNFLNPDIVLELLRVEEE
jgi:hypothetical protein